MQKRGSDAHGITTGGLKVPVFSQVGDHLDGMKISSDNATDPLYIQLADRASVDSNEVNDGVVLDFDSNGALVGIDVQHASLRADIRKLSVLQLPFGELQAASARHSAYLTAGVERAAQKRKQILLGRP